MGLFQPLTSHSGPFRLEGSEANRSLTSDVNGNQDGVRVLRSVRRTRGGHGEDNNLLSVIRTTENIQLFDPSYIEFFIGEFDPGSGRTLAACLTHASRTG